MRSPEQTVYIVDDDEAVRDALGILLDTVEIPYRAFASADEFLEQLEGPRPGCLLLDVRMTGTSGLELQQLLIEREVPTPIIFITGHGDIPMAVEAMRRGAFDFIRKPFREQDLLDRIGEALALDQTVRAKKLESTAARKKIAALSARERDVLDRVGKGHANKVIAMDLGISERTVEVHRANVMKKMDAKSLAQLVRMKIVADS